MQNSDGTTFFHAGTDKNDFTSDFTEVVKNFNCVNFCVTFAEVNDKFYEHISHAQIWTCKELSVKISKKTEKNIFETLQKEGKQN